jgi:hypothetical protein
MSDLTAQQEFDLLENTEKYKTLICAHTQMETERCRIIKELMAINKAIDNMEAPLLAACSKETTNPCPAITGCFSYCDDCPVENICPYPEKEYSE